MKTKRFIVEIKVDEDNIRDKYPNYSLNFGSPNQFIKMLMKDFVYEGNTDMSKQGLKKWGYSKKVICEVE